MTAEWYCKGVNDLGLVAMVEKDDNTLHQQPAAIFNNRLHWNANSWRNECMWCYVGSKARRQKWFYMRSSAEQYLCNYVKGSTKSCLYPKL